jgi:hypothetical protein
VAFDLVNLGNPPLRESDRLPSRHLPAPPPLQLEAVTQMPQQELSSNFPACVRSSPSFSRVCSIYLCQNLPFGPQVGASDGFDAINFDFGTLPDFQAGIDPIVPQLDLLDLFSASSPGPAASFGSISAFDLAATPGMEEACVSATPSIHSSVSSLPNSLASIGRGSPYSLVNRRGRHSTPKPPPLSVPEAIEAARTRSPLLAFFAAIGVAFNVGRYLNLFLVNSATMCGELDTDFFLLPPPTTTLYNKHTTELIKMCRSHPTVFQSWGLGEYDSKLHFLCYFQRLRDSDLSYHIRHSRPIE